MKVTLWMAMSVNGIIARENNEEDFISDDNWMTWLERARAAGNVVWGRKTYEAVKTWGKRYLDDLAGIRVIVVTSNRNYTIDQNFELATSPQDALSKLENSGAKELLVTSGATLNSSFARIGAFDEVVVNIEPIIVGKGIPLFSPDVFDLKLKLVEMTQSRGETIQLRYKTIR